MIRGLILVLCSAAVGVLVYVNMPGAHAQFDGRLKPAEEQIKQRAQRRWQHILDDAMPKAHAYYAPGYRESYEVFKTASQYGGQVERQSVSIDRVHIDTASPGRAIVYYTVQVVVRQGDSAGELVFPSTGREVWIKRGGLWWYAADYPYS